MTFTPIQSVGIGFPLQLGIFISFHPVFALVLVGMGVFLLAYWFISDNVFPAVFVDSLPLSVEMLIASPICLGVVLVTYGVTSAGGIFWAFMLTMSMMGKVIEGGITFYGLRKIASYLQATIDWLKKKLPIWTHSKPQNNAVPVKTKLKLKGYSRIIIGVTKFGLVIAAFAITVFIAFSLFPAPTAVAISWSVLIGGFSLATLLKNSRVVRHDIGIPAVVGIIYLVVGTEIYEYPNGILASGYVPVLNQLFTFLRQTLGDGMIGFNLSPLELVVLFLNPIAYVFGLVVAFVLWKWAPRPYRTPFGAVYRNTNQR